MSAEKWQKDVWLAKLKEVVDKYQPDIIWFDSWLNFIPEKYRQEFSAYYLNEAKKLNKEVVIVRKGDDLPLDFTINDHEKYREAMISEKVWMTDDTISTKIWSYVDGMKMKSPQQVLHSIIDTVSKNGIVLLNLSPKADGSIPQDQRVLLKLRYSAKDWRYTQSKSGSTVYATQLGTVRRGRSIFLN